MRNVTTVEVSVKSEPPGGTEVKALGAHLSDIEDERKKVYALESLFYSALNEVFGYGVYYCEIKRRVS